MKHTIEVLVDEFILIRDGEITFKMIKERLDIKVKDTVNFVCVSNGNKWNSKINTCIKSVSREEGVRKGYCVIGFTHGLRKEF
jgi:hypothetical protein